MTTQGRTGLARIKRVYPPWTITVGGSTARRGDVVSRGAGTSEWAVWLGERVSSVSGRPWSRRRLAVDECGITRRTLQGRPARSSAARPACPSHALKTRRPEGTR